MKTKTNRKKKRKDLASTIIDTTLKEIGKNGVANLTTKTISQSAETSTGIIHHYFDTKDELVLLSYRRLLLDHRSVTTQARAQHPSDPIARLKATLHVQFDDTIFSDDIVRVWPHLWANAMHDSDVSKLLLLYNRRLFGNILYDLNRICDSKKEARLRAHTLMAMIHGLWIERYIVKNAETDICLETIDACIGTP